MIRQKRILFLCSLLFLFFSTSSELRLSSGEQVFEGKNRFLESFFSLILLKSLIGSVKNEVKCMVSVENIFHLTNEYSTPTVYDMVKGGARGVMAIVVENGRGATSSNPGRG